MAGGNDINVAPLWLTRDSFDSENGWASNKIEVLAKRSNDIEVARIKR